MEYNISQKQKQDRFDYHRHIAQTGKPTRQLRQTMTETFELLNLLQDNETAVPADTLAERMSELSLNLRDLGMREEALGIQTMCVVIHRGLVQQHGHSLATSWKLAQSLNNLSICHCVLSATERKQCKQQRSL